VAPVADRGGWSRPGFEDDGVEAAVDELGCGCQTDRSRSYHDNGVVLGHANS
jgi:hypothetical protein